MHPYYEPFEARDNGNPVVLVGLKHYCFAACAMVQYAWPLVSG